MKRKGRLIAAQRELLPTPSPKEEPENGRNDNDPKNRVDDDTEYRGDHHYDNGYQDVDEHCFSPCSRDDTQRGTGPSMVGPMAMSTASLATPSPPSLMLFGWGSWRGPGLSVPADAYLGSWHTEMKKPYLGRGTTPG